MGCAQSREEEAAATLQSYILHVANPEAWKTLPPTEACTVFFPPEFADDLRPAFAEILQSFYLLDYRKALDACATFFAQLTAAKHQLGHRYGCTVASFCAIRTLLHIQMGYYTFPGDLPEPIPPYLQPIPADVVFQTPEQATFRLASCLFEQHKSSEASCAALGYTQQQHHALMQANALFFTRYADARLALLHGPQPLNDIELLFWIFLPGFFSHSCSDAALPTTGLLTASTWSTTYTRTIAPALFSPLARDKRIELLGLLADQLRENNIDPPSNMTPLCQSLLYTAKTRFQHVRLRHASVVRSTELSHLSYAAKKEADAELDACIAICTDSGPPLAPLAALCQRGIRFSNLQRFAANRAAWDKAGNLGFVEMADFCHVHWFLFDEDDELTVKTTGLELGMTALGRMYELERARWGPAGVKTWDGRWCYLAESIKNWLHMLLEMEPTRPAPVGVMLAFAVEYLRKARDGGMRPCLEQEESIWGSCLALWGKYKGAAHGVGLASKFLLGVGREMARLGVEWFDEQIRKEEQGWLTGVKELQESRATFMTLYLELSILGARFAGGSRETASALDRLEPKLIDEAVRDSQQGLTSNAVIKCALLGLLSLYHPARALMTTPEEGGGSRFGWASKAVDDDSLWINNEPERVRARGYLHLVRGAWLAWNGPDGLRRRGGRGPRKVPSSPSWSDVWTWEYEFLGANPHLVDDDASALMIRKRHLANETKNTELRVKWDGYLENCFREAQEVLGMDGGSARFLVDV